LKDLDVAIGAVIDDPYPSARAKHPDGFAKSKGAFVVAWDIAEGQAAEDHIERIGREGKVPCVGFDEVGSFADALDHRVVLGGGPAVPCLVTQPPDIGSGRAALGDPVGCRDKDGAAAATDVEYLLVASQGEFIEQVLPDRQLARTGAVEVARGDSGDGGAPGLRQSAGNVLVSSLRPPATSQKTGSGKNEDRNAGVPSVDAVAGSISAHLTEYASGGVSPPRPGLNGLRSNGRDTSSAKRAASSPA
jgi:hypothetical protein